VLTATRVYPLLQFRYDATSANERRRAKVLRVDYRLEFSIDPQVLIVNMFGVGVSPGRDRD
jgi:hypothetical protein